MAIVTAQAVAPEVAIAQAAQVQQAVQAVIQAAQPVAAVAAVVTPAGTITNDPVVLPATGAAPEPVAAAVEVTPPLADAGGADTSATDATQSSEPTTAAAPLTKGEQLAAKIAVLEKRVAADTTKLEQLRGLLNAVDLLAGIKAGSVIVAKVGRADTAKEVVATVVGVQTLESGDLRFKIYFGEGFDADTVVIQESQIVDVKQV